VPLLDIQAQQTALQQILQIEQAGGGGLGPIHVKPQPGPNGTVGVLPSGTVPTTSGPGSTDTGGTTGDHPSATGFSYQYIQPREIIFLSDKLDEEFLYPERKAKIRIKRQDPGDGVLARYSPEEGTVFLSDRISEDDEKKYLNAIGEALVTA
jgi:hypothetical protein